MAIGVSLGSVVFDCGCAREPGTETWIKRIPDCTAYHPAPGERILARGAVDCSACGAKLTEENRATLLSGAVVHLGCAGAKPPRSDVIQAAAEHLTRRAVERAVRSAETAGKPAVANALCQAGAEVLPLARPALNLTLDLDPRALSIAPIPIHAEAGPRVLRALSLSRPWPWAIFHLPPDKAKHVENRDRRFAEVLGAPFVVLHAAKSWDAAGASFIANLTGIDVPAEAAHPVGFVGVVRFAEIMERMSLEGAQRARQDPWFFGPWGHFFTDARVFVKPIPGRGYPSVFTLTDEQAAAVHKHLSRR